MKKETNRTSAEAEETNAIKNPHNNFVVKLFENSNNARRYIKSRLPKEIVDDIDWRTLKPSKVTWIDEKLKTVYSDINFTAKWKGIDVYLPIVLEHQSTKPVVPHLKMLRYLLNGYDYQIEQIEIGKKEGTIKKGKAPKLTVIIPMFLYNGKEKWEYRPFSEFFDQVNEHLIDFIPNFKYLLHNLADTSNEELFQQKELGILAAAFLLLKNYKDKDYIVSYSAEIIGLAQTYSDGSTYFRFFLKIALSYMTSAVKVGKKDVDDIIDAIDNPKLKNPVMNAIEEYQLEATKKVKREMVINFLKEELDISAEKIAKIAGVTVYFVRKIKKELKEQNK